MKKVYLIHGFEGSPNGGWRPYLMEELKKHDIYACSLSMPHPGNPLLSEWLSEIKRLVDRDVNDEVYLIGHSLGGTTILRYLERYNDKNIKGAILISSPCEDVGYEKILEFVKPDINWNNIKSKINKIAVIHGEDDPVVPVSHAEKIAKELNCDLILIKNGKHLSGHEGFMELPEALKVILEMIK